MDTSAWNTMSKGQQITAGGGLAALIAGFLPWYVLKEQFIDSVSFKGTEFTFGWMGLVLLLAAAALTVAPAFGKSIGNDQITGEQIAIVAAGLGAVLWAIRLVQVPALFFGVMGRGVGLYLAAIAAGTVIAGVVITMKEKGIAMPTIDTVKSVTNGVTATDTTTAAAAPMAPTPVAQAPAPQQHPAPTPAPAPAPAPAPQQYQAPVDNSARTEF